MSAVKYMDGYFNVFWQPELLDGSRLYVSDCLYLWMTPDLNYGFASPKVYKSKLRALRVANRKMQEEKKDRLAELKEVWE